MINKSDGADWERRRSGQAKGQAAHFGVDRFACWIEICRGGWISIAVEVRMKGGRVYHNRDYSVAVASELLNDIRIYVNQQ